MPRRANRVDANQADIVAAVRRFGAAWIPCTGDPSIGFDGLIAWRGRLLPCEIKDGSKPKSARKLTDTEYNRQLQLNGHNVPYLIVESVEGLCQAMVREWAREKGSIA